jgi:hypothetical protein
MKQGRTAVRPICMNLGARIRGKFEHKGKE